MTDRFAHLKKKKEENKLDIEEFILSAEQERNAVELTKKKPQKEDVYLFASGRVNRTKNYGRSILLYLRKDIENDIDKHCVGNKSSILNFLIREGLDSIISKKEVILHTENE